MARPLGAANKRRGWIEARFKQEFGIEWHALIDLARVARGERLPDYVLADGSLIDETPTLEMRVHALKELVPYLVPKLKSVDVQVTQDENRLSDVERLARIAAILEAGRERGTGQPVIEHGPVDTDDRTADGSALQ